MITLDTQTYICKSNGVDFRQVGNISASGIITYRADDTIYRFNKFHKLIETRKLPKLTHEWINAFGPTRNLIRVRGSNIVFVGKRGAMFRCRLSYLAKREGISFRRFIIDAIKRGCGV